MPSSTNGYLPVSGDGHRVYWEVEGDEGQEKIPVLVLHGGWGPLQHDGGFLDRSRFYRVYIHQRGWGNSTPKGMQVSQIQDPNFLQAASLATVLPLSWQTLRPFACSWESSVGWWLEAALELCLLLPMLPTILHAVEAFSSGDSGALENRSYCMTMRIQEGRQSSSQKNGKLFCNINLIPNALLFAHTTAW